MSSVYRTDPSERLFIASGDYPTRLDRLQVYYEGYTDIPSGQFIVAHLYAGGVSNGGVAISGASTIATRNLAANGGSPSAVVYWYKPVSSATMLVTGFDVVPGHTYWEFNFADLGGFTAPAGWGTYFYIEAYQTTPDGTTSTNISGAFRIGAYFTEIDG